MTSRVEDTIFINMAAVQKKTSVEVKDIAEKEEKPALKTTDVKEEIVAQEAIIKTTGDVKIVEEAPASKSVSENPLSEFKKKLSREEFAPSDDGPKKNYMWPILIVFIIAIILLIGIFIYKQGIFKTTDISVTTPSPLSTSTPEPTREPDLTKFEIEIQNGSEVAGEAGRQKTGLEAEGFTVSSIGNADNSDYTDTIVKAKAEVDKAFVDKLKTVLESSFSSVTEEELSEDSLVPVIVILGTKK